MGSYFLGISSNVSVNILHLEWILPCFHYFSPKHHAIPPCTPYQFFSVGSTSQLCAINTEHQILLAFVPTQCLHLGYIFNKPHGTSHTLMEYGLTPHCHLVKPWMLYKIGKIVITSTEITRDLGRDESVRPLCRTSWKVWDQQVWVVKKIVWICQCFLG